MPFPIKDFILQRNIGSAALATNKIVFTAPFDVELVSVQARQRVASTSGTMDIVRVPNGIAIGSGTSLLTALMSSAGSADTNVTGSLNPATGARTISKGQSLGLIFAGTTGSLADLDITFVLRQLRKN